MLLNGEMHLYNRDGRLQLEAKNFEVPENWPDLLVRLLETLQGRAVSTEQQVIEDVLIAWLTDVEELPGMQEYQGPFTTPTDKLHQLARKVRDYRSGR